MRRGLVQTVDLFRDEDGREVDASYATTTSAAYGPRSVQGATVLNYLRSRGNAAARTARSSNIPNTPRQVAKDSFMDFLIGNGVSEADAVRATLDFDAAGAFTGGWQFDRFENRMLSFFGRGFVDDILGTPSGSQALSMLPPNINAMFQLLVAGRLQSQKMLRRQEAGAREADENPGNVLARVRAMQRGEMPGSVRDLLQPNRFNLRSPADTILKGVTEPERSIAIPDALTAQGGAQEIKGAELDQVRAELGGDRVAAIIRQDPITEMADEPITADLAMGSIVGEKRARELEEDIGDAAKRSRPDEAMGGAMESKEADASDQFDDVVDVGDFFGGYYSGDEFVSTSSNAFDDVVGVGDLYNRTGDPFDEFGN